MFVFFGVIVFAIFILILISGSVIAAKKTSVEDGGGQDMVKVLYNYLVLFATLMMTIGGSVAAFMAIADIASPPPYYQSFESFKEMKMHEKGAPAETESAPELSEEEMQARYNLMIEEEKKNVKARAINSLIKSLGWIVIPFPIFIYFQKKVRKTAV